MLSAIPMEVILALGVALDGLAIDFPGGRVGVLFGASKVRLVDCSLLKKDLVLALGQEVLHALDGEIVAFDSEMGNQDGVIAPDYLHKNVIH